MLPRQQSQKDFTIFIVTVMGRREVFIPFWIENNLHRVQWCLTLSEMISRDWMVDDKSGPLTASLRANNFLGEEQTALVNNPVYL